MSDGRLHVVFGTGQVGRALSARLTALGLSVRAVSRHRPAGLVDGVDWRAADASDAEAATQAADGAAVIYQCLNAPYTDWPERFPPLQRGGAERRATPGCAPGEPRERLRLRPDRGQADDRGSPAGSDDRQGQNPGGDDPGAARRRAGRSRSHRDRTGVGLLRRGRHRVDARRARVRKGPRRQACRLPRQPGPAAHLQLRPRHRRRAGDPGHRRSSSGRSVAPAGPGDRDHPPGPRADLRRGRTPGRGTDGAQARSCARSGWSTR